MADAMRAHELHATSCEGYLVGISESRKLGRSPSISQFEEMNGFKFSGSAGISNSDSSYVIPLAIDSTIQYPKHLNSYCQVEGFAATGKGRVRGILVTKIFETDPKYDFASDLQYAELGISSLDDLLGYFPRQVISESEKKHIALLATLAGAQEKDKTAGGIGTSILFPSGMVEGSQSRKVHASELSGLMSSIRDSWFPYQTLGRVSPNQPSLFTGDYQDVLQTVRTPGSFLKHKINRDILQGIPKSEIRNPQVFDILRYSHLPVYLDDSISWLEKSRDVALYLLRSRMTRVSTPASIIRDAGESEAELGADFYDQYRINLKLKTTILDVSESIAKLNNRTVVERSDFSEAKRLVFDLFRDSAQAIGERGRLFASSHDLLSGKEKTVINLLRELGTLPVGEFLKILAGKGFSAAESEILLSRLDQYCLIIRFNRHGSQVIRAVDPG